MQIIKTNDGSKKVLRFLGVIVVGVISSAVWDLAKPLLSGALKYTIAVSTLGLTRLQDSIYIKATGNQVSLAVLTAMLFVAAFVCFTGVLILVALIRHRTIDSRLAVTRVGIISLSVLHVLMMFQLFQLIYSSQWMSYRLRLERLAATYSTEQQIRARAVEVDQIESKDAFLKYITALEKDVRLHGLPLPTKDPRSTDGR